MQPRAILLDVDGVVINGYHFKPELRRYWDEHLEADLGIARDVFYDVFIKDIFVNTVLTGKKALVTALDEVLPALNYRGSALDIAGYWISRDIHLNLPLLRCVRQLRKGGVKVYLATNQEHIRAAQLWQTLGLNLLFDDIYYSARLGVCKPQSGFFENVAQRLGHTDILMFDDTPHVIDAARAQGWDAVLYNTLNDFTEHAWIKGQLAL